MTKALAPAVIALSVALSAAAPARVPVLGQIALPHNYYFRELYLPQLTSGPSSVAWSADGQTLVYSMQGSLWQQHAGTAVAEQLTDGAGDYQPHCSPDGRSVVFVRYDGRSLELMLLDLMTRQVRALTTNGAVNVEPPLVARRRPPRLRVHGWNRPLPRAYRRRPQWQARAD